MKSPTALITGILGQDGPYLAKLLLSKGYKVFGLIRNTNSDFSNLDYLGITDQISYIVGDLTDEDSLIGAIRKIQPDELYNLASQSFIGTSWEKNSKTTEINALGVLYLLNAVKEHSPNTKFYQASTSEIFGASHIDGVQTENTPLHPRNPYGISKLYAYWITNNYKEAYGMFCCNGIMFNHESPIRGQEFVTRKITAGVARIKLGLADTIKLANLENQRDWGFAGDYVEAMYLMMQQEKPDNYIISTGITHSIRDFCEVAFTHVGINDWQKYVTIDESFKRPTDQIIVTGVSEKAKQVLGWTPTMGFEELVKTMVDADIDRLK